MSLDFAVPVSAPDTAVTGPDATGPDSTAPESGGTARPLSPNALRAIVRDLAEQPDRWIHRVRLATGDRWYERLVSAEDHEVWLISWLPGQSTGFHDHGGSRGAFAVALGELEELSLGGPEDGLLVRRVAPGAVRAFGAAYLHDVRNTSAGPAVTIHAYSPPLSGMTRYDLRAGGLVRTAEEGPEQW
ncbi:cysteine dioxygenase family protein [Kitasatospora sp. NPDC085895]|uniref:cysteine dioxygenase n=1 Tax=Kitasatospora sp. NPDC085895 TaxID=3155057 RepID=UPI00344F4FD0